MESKKFVPSTTNGSHRKGRSPSGKSSNWVSRCGVKFPTQRAVHAHQRECPVCIGMIHSGPTAGKERVMHCGAVVRTRKKASEHFQSCLICQELRRRIRMETGKNLTHTQEMRQKYSETAKRTSARPEIQKVRAARLKIWRDNNPAEFEAIREKAHASPKRSKMEMWLEPHLEILGFSRNGRISCGQLRKQVDFVNARLRIAIEVDGPWHFLPIQSAENLQRVQQRDRLLDQEILNRSWRLIRLSMECFKTHGELIKPRLEELQAVIKTDDWVGIRCFGGLYEHVFWAGIKVMISK